MLCSVALVIFMSCLLAPSTDTPSDTPLPSTRILRFVPDLALSVGFGPVLFSPKRRFCNHSIHSLPFPIDPSFLSYMVNPSIHIRLKTPTFIHSWNLSCTVLEAPRLLGRAFH